MIKKNQDVNKENMTRLFEMAIRKNDGKYILTLFVAGSTPRSLRAIDNIKRLAEEHLKGKYELTIIDIFQNPVYAKKSQIIAAPTLIKKLPLPLKKFIGDMSNTGKIIAGLEIHEKKDETNREKSKKSKKRRSRDKRTP